MAFPHVGILIPDNLPHTAILQKMTSIRDSLGGDQKHWATVQEVQCFVQEASRAARMEFQGRLAELTHKIYLSDSVFVNQQHRFVFNRREYKVLATGHATVNLYPSLNCALCQVLDGDIDADDPS